MPASSTENNSNNEKRYSTTAPTSETGAPHSAGGFRHHRDGDRWQWSDAVARMRGYAPTTELIFSHNTPTTAPHIAHNLNAIRTSGGPFGGFVTQEEVDDGSVKIFVPEGFVEHAVSENVYAGTAMNRRAGYMYGAALARGPQGQVGGGLGQTLLSELSP